MSVFRISVGFRIKSSLDDDDLFNTPIRHPLHVPVYLAVSPVVKDMKTLLPEAAHGDPFLRIVISNTIKSLNTDHTLFDPPLPFRLLAGALDHDVFVLCAVEIAFIALIARPSRVDAKMFAEMTVALSLTLGCSGGAKTTGGGFGGLTEGFAAEVAPGVAADAGEFVAAGSLYEGQAAAGAGALYGGGASRFDGCAEGEEERFVADVWVVPGF